MIHRLRNLFILLYCSYNYGVGDCFYIFDVGQGNCQLAIYEEEKIGILFDCGSSSAQRLVKFSKLQKSNYTSIFERNSRQSESPKKVISKEQFFKENQTRNGESEDSLSQTWTDSHPARNLTSLSDLIKSYELKYLFIILSHPDKDHINLINSKLLSNLSLPVMALLEGDWFMNITEVVNVVLDVLKNYPNICIDFPFYSKGLWGINQEDVCTYQTILDKFWRSDIKGIFSLFDGWKSIIPALQIEDLQSVILRKSSEKVNNFECFKDILHLEDFSYVYSPLFDVLKNIKIVHINFPFKDVNSQSSIVEIKMPKLKMQFFLTGDASNETFSRIIEHDVNFFKKDKDYTSFAMLPHHGSKENKSSLFFKLFQPDIIGISAGNGGQFTHPSKTFIQEIKAQKYSGSF